MKRTLCFAVLISVPLPFAVRAGDGQIDIASLPCVIEAPGSYIVVKDLTLEDLDTPGIVIAADNVTLDLNGHTLTGPGPEAGATGSGISVVPPRANITIRNGVIQRWRGYGIEAKLVNNASYENLRCRENGGAGLGADNNSLIRGNTCEDNRSHGIEAGSKCVITANACNNNAAVGIRAGSDSIVTDNVSSSNDHDGITAAYGSVVSGNACNYNDFSGITGDHGVVISNNSCYENLGHGISIGQKCRVADNSCVLNGHESIIAGIHVSGSQNVIEGNSCVENMRGISVEATGNVVRDNVLKGNQTAIEALPDNQLDILISDLPFTINVPGNYRVTGRLSLSTPDANGITIQANNVTLDLGGNALVGPGKTTGTTGHGILVDENFTDVVIRNGTVRDWRKAGVYGVTSVNARYEGLRASQNGESGLVTGIASIISRCGAESNSGGGIEAGPGSVVENSVSWNNIGWGILSTSSTVYANTCTGNGIGIQSTSGSTVRNNTCQDNGIGIVSMLGCFIEGNNCMANTSHGMSVSDNCRIIGNLCSRNGSGAPTGYGINIYGMRNDVEGNTVVENDTGIFSNATLNYFASNRAANNTTPYSIVGGNTLGTGDLANITY